MARSKLDYAGHAWQSFSSNTNITNMDRLQNQALCLITGQIVSTPLKGLCLECSVQIYYTESKHIIVRAKEKYLRTAVDHPKRLSLRNCISHCIVTHSSFCSKTTELLTILPEELSQRQFFNLFPSPPCLISSFCTNQFFSTTPGISGRDHQPAHKLEKRLEHISSIQVDFTIYTDGSASAGTMNRRAAALISTGSPIQPTSPTQHHQNKGSCIHQLQRRTSYCHGSCFTVDIYKRQLSPDFHPHLHGKPIPIWNTRTMQPSSHLHSWMHIVHFIIHLHTMGARTLQHSWQLRCRQSSKRSNHNWIRYHQLRTNFMSVSGHQWIFSWQFTFARPHKWSLPISQDFDWSTADRKLQRRCADRSTPF